MHGLLRILVLLIFVATALVPATVFAQNSAGQNQDERVDPPNLSTTRLGETGTFRVVSGYTPFKNRFSIGAGLQYWQQSDYLGPNFSHKHLHTIGHVTISPTDWMEVFVAGISTSHQYQDELVQGAPQLVQSIGDIHLGSKFGFEANEFFYLGADWFVRFNTRQGNLGPAFSATSVGARILPTFDLTMLPDPKPFRFLMNFGYVRDNTRNVVMVEDEDQRGVVGSPHLQSALGIPPTEDSFVGGFAIEVPQNYLSLILEYTTEQYRYFGDEDRPSRTYSTSPQRLTPGVRFFPLAGLAIDLYSDLGAGLLGFTDGVVPEQSLTDQREEIMPNWTANLGITYNFTPPPPPAPKEGVVRGLVTDGRTGRPIANAVIRFPGKDVTSLVTDENGRFSSYRFAGGEIEVVASRDNYEPVKEVASIVPGQETTVNIQLNPIEQVGLFAGTVKDEEERPILASISFEGTNLPNVATDPASGNFEVRLAPDVYTIRVTANGYESDSRRIRVVNRRTTRIAITLAEKQTFGTLMGTIESEAGQPVAAVVSFRDSSIRPIAANPSTGHFEDRIEPGEYEIRASAAGFEAQTKRVVVEQGRSAMANFTLKPVVTSGRLRGQVVDKNTGEGLYAVISSPTGEFSNLVADPETGRFSQNLPGGEYIIRAAAPNFRASQLEVTIKNGETTDAKFELEGFQKIEVTQEAIEIKEKVQFATGRDTILFDSYPLLDEIGAAIADLPDMRVVIEGHTDSQGAASYNMDLSRRRAEAVREYLISRGVSGTQLRAVGYGEERPIATNQTEAGREQNRRVEFRIVE